MTESRAVQESQEEKKGLQRENIEVEDDGQVSSCVTLTRLQWLPSRHACHTPVTLHIVWCSCKPAATAA